MAADEFQISNRSPKPGEIGYRPEDGGTASLNPPSLIWLHEKQAARYSVQWAPADSRDLTTVEGIPWNTYTHHTPWKPGTVEQPKAGVEARYLSPLPLAFRQWDGFAPPPKKDFPNQWHVEAGTKDKRRQVAMLTVLAPYRTGQRPDWSAERVESDNAVGLRVVLNGKSTTISFPKSVGGGPLRVEQK